MQAAFNRRRHHRSTAAVSLVHAIWNFGQVETPLPRGRWAWPGGLGGLGQGAGPKSWMEDNVSCGCFRMQRMLRQPTKFRLLPAKLTAQVKVKICAEPPEKWVVAPFSRRIRTRIRIRIRGPGTGTVTKWQTNARQTRTWTHFSCNCISAV